MNKKPNPKSSARNLEAAQTDSKSMARKFDESGVLRLQPPDIEIRRRLSWPPCYLGSTTVEIDPLVIHIFRPN